MRFKQSLSSIVHFFTGLISSLLWFFDWKLSVFIYIQFLVYELVEERKIVDTMYRELLEYFVGFVLGVLVMLYARLSHTCV